MEEVEKANGDVFEELLGDPRQGFSDMATRMVGALRAENKRMEARVQSLGREMGFSG